MTTTQVRRGEDNGICEMATRNPPGPAKYCPNPATSVCGSNFLTGSVQAAGGLGDGIVAASGAIPNVGAVNGLLGAAAAGFISLAFL